MPKVVVERKRPVSKKKLLAMLKEILNDWKAWTAGVYERVEELLEKDHHVSWSRVIQVLEQLKNEFALIKLFYGSIYSDVEDKFEKLDTGKRGCEYERTKSFRNLNEYFKNENSEEIKTEPETIVSEVEKPKLEKTKH